MAKEKVIIIGAGMAGLTAAHYLTKAGIEVMLLERLSRPGGRILSVEADGGNIDMGAQFFHTNYIETYELLKAYNLESDLVELDNPDMVMRNNRKFLLHPNSIRLPVISLWSQLKMLRMILPMWMRKKDMSWPNWSNLMDLDKLELTTYTRMKLNREILEYLVRLIAGAYSLSDPEGISMAYFSRATYMYLTTKVHALRNGNDALPKAMARNLKIEYETEVKQIVSDSQGNVAGIKTSGGDIEASILISAVPSTELLPLFDAWNSAQKDLLRNFTYSKMPLVMLESQKPFEDKFYIGLFDRSAGIRLAGVTFPHNKYKKAAAPRYIQAWPVGGFGEEMLELPDDKIIEIITSEIEKADASYTASIVSAQVYRHENMYPQYHIGMFEKLLRFNQSEGFQKGLYLIGDYTEGGLVEGAALSGRKAAGRIINNSHV
jgi:oxygen-dependent protoporphyrinogen oxidase